MLNLYLKVIRLRNWSEDFSGQPPFVFFGEQRNRSWGIPGHPVRHCCSWRRSNALSFAHGQQTAVTNHICCVFVIPHIYHFFTFFFINVLFIQLEILHDGKKLRTPQKNITLHMPWSESYPSLGFQKFLSRKSGPCDVSHLPYSFPAVTLKSPCYRSDISARKQSVNGDMCQAEPDAHKKCWSLKRMPLWCLNQDKWIGVSEI